MIVAKNNLIFMKKWTNFYVRDCYANPDSGFLRSGLFRLGKVRGANFWPALNDPSLWPA